MGPAGTLTVEVVSATAGTMIGAWDMPVTATAGDMKKKVLEKSKTEDIRVKLLHGEKSEQPLKDTDVLQCRRVGEAPVVLGCIKEVHKATYRCSTCGEHAP